MSATAKRSSITIHELRDYQSDLLRNVVAEWHAGARNVLAVSPTGSGKTVVFAYAIANHPGSSVAIAHRAELVSQMSLALAREGVRHRVIGPATLGRTCARLHMDELQRLYVDPGARCAVASVDTLVRMDKADPWFAQVTLWVQDEAHHVLVDNKWGDACAMFPNARGLGVTATPVRADGRGLGRHADGLMDAMVVGATMRELIERDFLTEYRVFAPPSDIDLSAVAVTASGDYSPPKLKAARRASHITGDVVAHYLRIAPGKLGITFDTDIESATETAAAFRAAGVPAELVTGESHPEFRASALRRFRNREVLQLVNVSLFDEGFDLPAIEVVSMAAPTQSYGRYVQQFGRALRPLPGKTHAIIIDHVGNVLRHGLPDAYREWSLDRRERRSRSAPADAIPVRTCLNPECLSVYERIYSACPFCGQVVVPAARNAPEFVDGDLLELDQAALAALRGEKARIDAAVQVPHNLVGTPAEHRLRRVHWERQEGQKPLRDAIALWAGWQNTLGRPDPEVYRRFYFKFGVDILTAQSLGAAEAAELTERVSTELARHSVEHA